MTWHQFYKLAARAGLKVWETDRTCPRDVWLMIDAWLENEQVGWEQTRALAFNIGAYGNSDPKRFPKTPQKFWPLSWDKEISAGGGSRAEEIMKQHERMVERRKQLENKIKK